MFTDSRTKPPFAICRRSLRRAGAALLLAGLLAACATAQPVNFGNGQPGYAIHCDLGLNGLEQCYRKAGSLCLDRGYSLHDWQGLPITSQAVEQDLEQSFSTFAAKSILVQCNPG